MADWPATAKEAGREVEKVRETIFAKLDAIFSVRSVVRRSMAQLLHKFLRIQKHQLSGNDGKISF